MTSKLRVELRNLFASREAKRTGFVIRRGVCSSYRLSRDEAAEIAARRHQLHKAVIEQNDAVEDQILRLGQVELVRAGAAIALQLGAVLDDAVELLLPHALLRDLESRAFKDALEFARREFADVADIVGRVVPDIERGMDARAEEHFYPVLQVGDIRAAGHQNAAGLQNTEHFAKEVLARGREVLDQIDSRDQIEGVVVIGQAILDHVALMDFHAVAFPHLACGMLLLIEKLIFGAVEAIHQMELIAAKLPQHDVVDAARPANVENLRALVRHCRANEGDVGQIFKLVGPDVAAHCFGQLGQGLLERILYGGFISHDSLRQFDYTTSKSDRSMRNSTLAGSTRSPIALPTMRNLLGRKRRGIRNNGRQSLCVPVIRRITSTSG